MSNTISLVTQQHAPKLANPANTLSAITTVNRFPSSVPSGSGTTKPISIITGSNSPTTPGGLLVVPAGMNYLKIFPWWAAAASALTPTIRCVGWSYSKDSTLWLPHLLANISCVLSSDTTATIAGATLTPCVSFTNGTGDAKMFNATGLKTTGFFVIDTVGFELIELCFQTITTACACNAHVSEI